jgi:hypothetical protein
VTNALDKDPAILTVLEQLRRRLGADSFVVADHWEPDLCAIGIASPQDHRVLVYISCYGEPVGRFGFELEVPPTPGSEMPYNVVGGGFGLSFEELVSVIARHLQTA